MARINLGLVTGAVALLLTTPGHAQDKSDTAEGIEQCRTISDTSARLACYDGIGRSEAAPPAPAPEARQDATPDPGPLDQPSQVASENTAYGELTDNVGLPKSADEYKPIPVTVVRCARSNNRKWYFYFDNGQVWQYLGTRALRYRGCNTPGLLVEDGMGFALKMDGDTAKHRVKRIK